MENRDYYIIGTVILLFFVGILLVVISFKNFYFPYEDDNRFYLKYKIVDNTRCLNQKDQFGFSVKCKISIKNLEKNLPIQFSPVFSCFKLSDRENINFIDAETKAIVSGEIEEFEINYDNGGREWSCYIVDAMPNEIYG